MCTRRQRCCCSWRLDQSQFPAELGRARAHVHACTRARMRNSEVSTSISSPPKSIPHRAKAVRNYVIFFGSTPQTISRNPPLKSAYSSGISPVISCHQLRTNPQVKMTLFLNGCDTTKAAQKSRQENLLTHMIGLPKIKVQHCNYR